MFFFYFKVYFLYFVARTNLATIPLHRPLIDNDVPYFSPIRLSLPQFPSIPQIDLNSSHFNQFPAPRFGTSKKTNFFYLLLFQCDCLLNKSTFFSSTTKWRQFKIKLIDNKSIFSCLPSPLLSH